MKLILCILNEISGFEVGASNGVYEVNVNTSFNILNNVKSCTPLDVLTLNPNHKLIASFSFELMERILYIPSVNDLLSPQPCTYVTESHRKPPLLTSRKITMALNMKHGA